jgi:hypothetical protein
MEHLKNRKKVSEDLNQLIDGYAEAKELAKSVDEILFDWIMYISKDGTTLGDWSTTIIERIKAIRDFFNNIETN